MVVSLFQREDSLMENMNRMHCWQEQQNLSSDTMDKMRKDEFLTDVTLVCGRKEFPAHKTHLCAASPYFYGMFKSGMKEATSDRVELQNIREESMQDILDFVYSGTFPANIDDMDKMGDVLEAADFLGIESLLKACLFFCEMSTGLACFLRQWQFADMYNCSRLLNHVIKLLAVNFSQVIESDDFLKLTCPQLKQVLKHPDRQVGPVEMTLRGILNWVTFKTEEERERELTGLLELVDLNRASASFLENNLLKNPLFSSANQPQLHKEVTMTTIVKELTPQPKQQLLFFWDTVVIPYDLDTGIFLPARNLPSPLHVPSLVTAFHDGHVYLVCNFQRQHEDMLNEGDEEMTKIVHEYSMDDEEFRFITQLKLGEAAVTVLNGLLYVVVSDNLYRAVGFSMFQRINPKSCETDVLAETNQYYCEPHLFPLRDCVYVIGSYDEEAHELSAEMYSPIANQWTIINRFSDPGRSFSLFHGSQLGDGRLVMCVETAANQTYFVIFDLVTHKWSLIDWNDGPAEVYELWHAPNSGGRGRVDEEEVNDSRLMVVDTDCMLQSFQLDTGVWEPLSSISDEDLADFPTFTTMLIN